MITYYSVSRKASHRMRIKALKAFLHHPERSINPRNSYYPDMPHKSKCMIFMEHIKHIMKYGVKFKEYYLYGLDVKGSKPSDYICERYNYEVLTFFNTVLEPNYAVTMGDKGLFAQIMHDNNLPIPRTYGLLLNGQLHLQGGIGTPVELEELLREDKKVLCKPVTGSGGRGILSVEVKDGSLFVDDSEMAIPKFRELVKSDIYLVQYFLNNQHEAMKALFAKSLNTIRVTMVRTDNGVEVLGVMCLMGSANAKYSNWHFGGICIGVDEEGRLRKYGFSNLDKMITKHPDTGVVFEGYQIPYFKETIQLCRKAMDVFYGMKSIGWDMAILDDGPVFIEGNHGWGIAAHQMVDQCGWAEKYHRAFGIARP